MIPSFVVNEGVFMPTYDFKCKECGLLFERFQSISDPIPPCPVCENDDVDRIVSGGAAVIFKGSGFYETDYKKKDQE